MWREGPPGRPLPPRVGRCSPSHTAEGCPLKRVCRKQQLILIPKRKVSSEWWGVKPGRGMNPCPLPGDFFPFSPVLGVWVQFRWRNLCSLYAHIRLREQPLTFAVERDFCLKHSFWIGTVPLSTWKAAPAWQGPQLTASLGLWPWFQPCPQWPSHLRLPDLMRAFGRGLSSRGTLLHPPDSLMNEAFCSATSRFVFLGAKAKQCSKWAAILGQGSNIWILGWNSGYIKSVFFGFFFW